MSCATFPLVRAHRLAHSGWVDAHIVNAGDGMHEHPTQALLDAATMRQVAHKEPRGEDLSGLSVVIVGDIAHPRVARSNVFLLETLGAKVTGSGTTRVFAARGRGLAGERNL